MARLFFGNTLAALKRTSASIVESTLAGRHDAAFVDRALKVSTRTDYLETHPFKGAASVTELWTHFEYYGGGENSGFYNDWVTWVNASGTPVYRVLVASANMIWQYWNGAWATWATLGSQPNFTLAQWDVRLVTGASGILELYKGKTLIGSASGGHAAADNIAQVRFGNSHWSANDSGNAGYFSQIMGADFDTRDSKLMLAAIDADSAVNNDGTGGFADINEGVLNDDSAISLPAVGNKATFEHAGIVIPEDYVIGAACAAARMRVGGGTVTDGKIVLQSGGTYDAGDARAPTGGYEGRGWSWENDPNTATRFTEAGFNAAEPGAEAV